MRKGNNMCNYNTDVSLWANKRKSLAACPNGGALLQIVDGHVHDGLQWLARFTDDSHAERVLLEAGFRKAQRGYKAEGGGL